MIKRCSAPSSANDLCQALQQNLAPKVFTPAMGVCYMFNFGQGQRLKVGGTKLASGLKLDIDIECK